MWKHSNGNYGSNRSSQSRPLNIPEGKALHLERPANGGSFFVWARGSGLVSGGSGCLDTAGSMMCVFSPLVRQCLKPTSCFLEMLKQIGYGGVCPVSGYGTDLVLV
jgi:hypothetical protein